MQFLELNAHKDQGTTTIGAEGEAQTCILTQQDTLAGLAFSQRLHDFIREGFGIENLDTLPVCERTPDETVSQYGACKVKTVEDDDTEYLQVFHPHSCVESGGIIATTTRTGNRRSKETHNLATCLDLGS